MTTASATMSERLLDLEDIIRPIAIEETRRYLDSRNLVTKEYLDSRNFVTKDYLDERLKHTEALVNERLQSTEKLLLEKHNGLLLRFILTLITVVGIALGVIRWMYPPVAAPAVVSTHIEAPLTQAR